MKLSKSYRVLLCNKFVARVSPLFFPISVASLTLLFSCGKEETEVDEGSETLAVVGPFLSKASARNVVSAAGFSGNNVNIAVAIAQCESSLGASSYAFGGGNRHTGLFQISDLHRGLCGGGSVAAFRNRMTNPSSNAACAKQLFNRRGGFGDWDCYRFGSYKKFL